MTETAMASEFKHWFESQFGVREVNNISELELCILNLENNTFSPG